MSKPRPRRVVVVSDFHCGHVVGLTPPGWDHDVKHPQLKKSNAMRRMIWAHYEDTLKALQPIDVLICNADLIEGKGERSGGTELLYADRLQQCEMAADAIQVARAKTVVMSYGTSYHTGRDEDLERVVAGRVSALKIGSRDDIDVNSTIINYRHYVGSSQVPHTRFTALGREALWNVLWSERGEYPKAHVILRSHVHYHVYAGGPGWLVMTTPALQGYGSKYGARMMSGIVDIGLLSFDVSGPNEYTWRSHLLRLPRSEPMKL